MTRNTGEIIKAKKGFNFACPTMELAELVKEMLILKIFNIN